MSDKIKDEKIVGVAQMQHDIIGVGKTSNQDFKSNPYPEAKWFADGGNLGLFIHYGI